MFTMGKNTVTKQIKERYKLQQKVTCSKRTMY